MRGAHNAVPAARPRRSRWAFITPTVGAAVTSGIGRRIVEVVVIVYDRVFSVEPNVADVEFVLTCERHGTFLPARSCSLRRPRPALSRTSQNWIRFLIRESRAPRPPRGKRNLSAAGAAPTGVRTATTAFNRGRAGERARRVRCWRMSLRQFRPRMRRLLLPIGLTHSSQVTFVRSAVVRGFNIDCICRDVVTMPRLSRR